MKSWWRSVEGQLPLYKYISNRTLAFIENLLCVKLSEHYPGFRVYSRTLLEAIPFDRNSDDFVFDNQLIAHALLFCFLVEEISCPAK